MIAERQHFPLEKKPTSPVSKSDLVQCKRIQESICVGKWTATSQPKQDAVPCFPDKLLLTA